MSQTWWRAGTICPSTKHSLAQQCWRELGALRGKVALSLSSVFRTSRLSRRAYDSWRLYNGLRLLKTVQRFAVGRAPGFSSVSTVTESCVFHRQSLAENDLNTFEFKSLSDAVEEIKKTIDPSNMRYVLLCCVKCPSEEGHFPSSPYWCSFLLLLLALSKTMWRFTWRTSNQA